MGNAYKLWLDNNLGSIDIDVLKSSNILTQDNTLDPMFLLALEFSTKFGAIDSNIGKVKPEFKEVLTYGTSILLERMGFTNDLLTAIAMFSSKYTTYTTGQNLTIDGGLTSK